MESGGSLRPCWRGIRRSARGGVDRRNRQQEVEARRDRAPSLLVGLERGGEIGAAAERAIMRRAPGRSPSSMKAQARAAARRRSRIASSWRIRERSSPPAVRWICGSRSAISRSTAVDAVEQRVEADRGSNGSKSRRSTLQWRRSISTLRERLFERVARRARHRPIARRADHRLERRQIGRILRRAGSSGPSTSVIDQQPALVLDHSSIDRGRALRSAASIVRLRPTGNRPGC